MNKNLRSLCPGSQKFLQRDHGSQAFQGIFLHVQFQNPQFLFFGGKVHGQFHKETV